MDPQTPDQARQSGERRTRRLQKLRLNGPDPEPEFDRIAGIAASLTQAPLAMVNFINADQQMFRGMYVPPSSPDGDGDGDGRPISFDLSDLPAEIPREAPINYGFCPHVVAQGSQLALDDVFAYPRFKGNPLVNEMGVRAYLGTPLRDHTGMILGTLCVADMKPRQWGTARKESMQQLAETLLSEFRLRDSLLAQQQEMFAIFDRAPFPIMLTEGPEHLLRYANAKQGTAFGRVRQLSPGRQVLSALDAVGVFNAMDHAYRTGQTMTLPEAQVTSFDSLMPQVFTFTCTPVRLSPSAPISGVLTVAMNITDQPSSDTEPRQFAQDFKHQLENLSPGNTGWPQPGQGDESSVFLR
ncbi:GAF domain-containing protein [Streptomyces sp. NPDC051776]|uniref:GAF domain-containing protein n=1 Tax=Streptomyces sp. NPDC051776 TaxID=3155414 RepID=UPI00342C7CBD